jgi:hypothetical protein
MPHFWDYGQLRSRDRLCQGEAVLHGKTGVVLTVDDQGWHGELAKPIRAAGRVRGGA